MSNLRNKELPNLLYSAKWKIRLFVFFPFLGIGVALLAGFWNPSDLGFWETFAIIFFISITSQEFYASKFLNEFEEQIREDEKKRLISKTYLKLGGKGKVTTKTIDFEKTLHNPVTEALLLWHEKRLTADLDKKEIYWSDFSELNSLIWDELKEKGYLENPFSYLENKLDDYFEREHKNS
jgi:hypothetical protein